MKSVQIMKPYRIYLNTMLIFMIIRVSMLKDQIERVQRLFTRRLITR